MAKKVTAPKNEVVPVAPFKPTAKDDVAVNAYYKREKERPSPGKIKIEKQKGEEISINIAPALGPLSKDKGAGIVAVARLTETFGGVDYDGANRLLRGLINATPTKGGVNDQFVNESLALVAAIAPQDGVEGMLAVQMVNAHGLISELQRRMINSVESIAQQDSNGGLLVRLLRTYTAQMEALKRYRTGGEQRVNVTHQHVTVNAEKAAVAVNPPSANRPGVGVTEKTEEQPHEPEPAQLAYAPSDPLPGALKADRQEVQERGG